MESQNMKKNEGFFSIESRLSRHTLSLDGQEIGEFATLEAAEAEAGRIVDFAVPGASLRFELDFKWTLSEAEIRVATVEYPGREAAL
jgi:hypothetical protein